MDSRYMNVIYACHCVKGSHWYFSVCFFERGEIWLRHPIRSIGDWMYIPTHRVVRIIRRFWTTVVANWTDFAVIRCRVHLSSHKHLSHSERAKMFAQRIFHFMLQITTLLFSLYFLRLHRANKLTCWKKETRYQPVFQAFHAKFDHLKHIPKFN